MLAERFAWRCVRTRAYHLESGSAHVIDQCVNSPEHGTYRKVVKSGTVRSEAAREALWFLLLANQVERRQVEASLQPLPLGVAIRKPSRSGHSFESVRSILGHEDSSPTVIHASVLVWRWQERLGPRTAGRIVLTAGTAIRYLDTLIDALDAGFTPGVAAQPLPPRIESPDDLDQTALFPSSTRGAP